jgi:hypothetical protein
VQASDFERIDVAIIKQMREWASDCQWLDGEDLDQYSDSQIARGVARHYEGGITQFVKDSEPVKGAL